jgi:hypothetical protein
LRWRCFSFTTIITPRIIYRSHGSIHQPHKNQSKHDKREYPNIHYYRSLIPLCYWQRVLCGCCIKSCLQQPSNLAVVMIDIAVYVIIIILLLYALVEYKILKPRRIKNSIKHVMGKIRVTIKSGTKPVTTSGRGIIITTTSPDVSDASNLFMCIAGIRHLGCTLPITIYSCYPQLATEIPWTKLNAAFVYKNIDPALIKLVALVDCNYAEVVVLDKDCICLQSPDWWFKSGKYIDTGLLMWNAPEIKGLTYIFPGDGVTWIQLAIPYKHHGNVILAGKGVTQASDSCVVMNRVTHTRTLTALRVLLDDKLNETATLKGYEPELVWVASELVGEPYAFMGTTIGTVGVKFGVTVKGLPVYFDDYGNLLWIYDEQSKMFDSYRSTDFTHYLMDSVIKQEPEEVYILNDAIMELVNWYYRRGRGFNVAVGGDN